MTSSIKPEVHNIIALLSEEDEATVTNNICREFRDFLEICKRTDRQRHTHHNTSHPYKGELTVVTAQMLPIGLHRLNHAIVALETLQYLADYYENPKQRQ